MNKKKFFETEEIKKSDSNPVSFTTNLSKKWTDILLELPESGMGYQNVLVKLKSGKIIKGQALNCSVLRTLEKINLEEIINLTLNKN